MQNHPFFYIRKVIPLLLCLPHFLFAANINSSNYSGIREVDSTADQQKVVKAAPCLPTSTTASQYINEIKFLGTLTADVSNASEFSGTGYADYTSLTQKAKQVPGGVINVNVTTSNAQGVILSTTKAWVDWNKDDVFDSTPPEKVYDISQIGAMSGNVIFGFVVPLGTPAGIYTIRIRSSGTDFEFDACNTIYSGETEDYSFEVVNQCSALITAVSAEKRCGAGSVVLTATATPDAVSYQWYASEFGEAIPNETSGTFTTPNLAVGTYMYYVTAFNGLCHSTFRTPVKVMVSPTPEIQFMQSSPEICGPITSTIISSTADKEEVILLEEDFDAENPLSVQFENIFAGNTNADGSWQVRKSPYVPQTPPYNVVKPAISSGYNGGNFANMITDVRQTTNIINHYVLKRPLNATGFTDLKLEFDLYFFSEEDIESKNYFVVQYSINGVDWIDLKRYIADVGIPSRFQNELLSLPVVCENQPNLKIRFTAYALGSRNEWMADIVAIDNVKLYGNKEVPANFIWTGNTTLFEGDCMSSPSLGGSPAICIKPTAQDNETKTQFSITASATLANGCSVSRTLIIPNNNKIWNPADGENWAAATWKPAVNVPDITKCVLVKKPVSIYSGGHFEAKNVRVAAEGKLNINGNASLKVQDAFINEALVNDVVIESGGNFMQINDDVNLNTGKITAKKALKITPERKQFNYLISPLEGQNLKAIYPGISSVIAYNEATSYFNNSNGEYIKGRSLAVKEPTVAGVPLEDTIVISKFVGNITNGAFTVPIVNSAPANSSRGYNLVGNPYPSAIDLLKLFEINGGANGTLNATFSFWDSSVNGIYVQQGENYGGQSYGQFNALNDTGVPATGDISIITTNIPTRYVQLGIGFMAKAMVPTMDLKFQNYIRTNQPVLSQALTKNNDSGAIDRFWISLISPADIASTAAVVYFSGGNSGLAQDDSSSLMGADAVYSIVEQKNISINGKSPFNQNDKVELGTAHFNAGNYTIKVLKREGIFETEQNIYLKDKQNGIVTNISAGHYTFIASSGITTGRFELVFQPETTLVTDSKVKDDVVIYRDSGDFVLKSKAKNITSIEVYDAVGRLVHQKFVNQKEIKLNGSLFMNGIYFLKINQNNQTMIKKIIK